MPKKSSKKTKHGFENDVVKRLINLHVTYRKASIPTLETLTFNDVDDALQKLSALKIVQECLILQTCNRIELFAVTSPQEPNPEQEIAEFWLKKTSSDPQQFYSALETLFGENALMHVLRLTSGLESMIIGEDQILGQTREAHQRAKKLGKSGPVLQSIFETALRTGVAVRRKTQINKGAVSIGSIAVNSLEDHLENLADKKILLIGAGQMGSLVGKALTQRKTSGIFVASRTYERAAWLAKILKAQAVDFADVVDTLTSADAVVVATASPHYVLTHEMVSTAMKKRGDRKLLIMDISQPRNVEELASTLPGVELQNIDNLRGIADINLQTRLEEAKKVEELLGSELNRLVTKLKQVQIEPLISLLYSQAEKKRRIEVDKALRMMKNAYQCQGNGSSCDKCRQIVDDLSRELIEKTLIDPVTNLRTAAAKNNINRILEAEALFNLDDGDENDVSPS